MDKNRHSLLIRFLGAAGEVTPSSTLLQVREHTAGEITKILMDAGSSIREETPDSTNLKSIEIIRNLMAVVLTHFHTDHTGSLPDVVQKNPTTPVFAPE